MKIEERLREMGIELPTPAKPVAEYVPAKEVGNLIFISGQDCRKNGELLYAGKLGGEVTLEQGRDAARQAAINALAVLKMHLGDLDNVKQIVKVLAFVNSADGFVEQPKVVNGASELFVEVFGEAGRHARSAIASNELPFDTAVELEVIVEKK